MTFTDEDLKNIKTRLKSIKEYDVICRYPIVHIEDLIARLEAAESVVLAVEKIHDLTMKAEWQKHIAQIEKGYFRWKKGAGK